MQQTSRSVIVEFKYLSLLAVQKPRFDFIFQH